MQILSRPESITIPGIEYGPIRHCHFICDCQPQGLGMLVEGLCGHMYIPVGYEGGAGAVKPRCPKCMEGGICHLCGTRWVGPL